MSVIVADNSGGEGTQLSNTVQFIPGTQEWRPPFRYKPTADGDELATGIVARRGGGRVVFGTKGGRPRDTTVIDRDKMLHAVNHALTMAAAQNSRLVDRPELKSAIDRYRNVARKAGLTGKSAPHT